VACIATLRGEHLFSTRSKLIKSIWISGRPQRINIERECIELLVAVTARSSRTSSFTITRWAKILIVREHDRILVHPGIAHQVFDSAVELESRVIQVSSFPYADEIRNLHRVYEAGPVP